MNDLKLFSVSLSQTWYADANVFVLANSKEEAEKASEKLVNLSPDDDWSSAIDITTKEVSILTLNDMKQTSEYWFIAEDKYGCFDHFDLDEFKSFISPEKLEELRIQKIEKDNGQISLLEN